MEETLKRDVFSNGNIPILITNNYFCGNFFNTLCGASLCMFIHTLTSLPKLCFMKLHLYVVVVIVCVKQKSLYYENVLLYLVLFLLRCRLMPSLYFKKLDFLANSYF